MSVYRTIGPLVLFSLLYELYSEDAHSTYELSKVEVNELLITHATVLYHYDNKPM